VGLSSGRTLKAEFYKRWIYRENACFPPACEEMDFSRGLVEEWLVSRIVAEKIINPADLRKTGLFPPVCGKKSTSGPTSDKSRRRCQGYATTYMI